jgi:hypothetical protein
MAWGKAPENPVTHVRPLRVNNRLVRYLWQEEIGRLLRWLMAISGRC